MLYFETNWIVKHSERSSYLDIFNIADNLNISLCVLHLYDAKGYHVKHIIAEVSAQVQIEEFIEQLKGKIELSSWTHIQKPDIFVRTMNPITELGSNILMIWMESLLVSAEHNEELLKSDLS